MHYFDHIFLDPSHVLFEICGVLQGQEVWFPCYFLLEYCLGKIVYMIILVSIYNVSLKELEVLCLCIVTSMTCLTVRSIVKIILSFCNEIVDTLSLEGHLESTDLTDKGQQSTLL